MKRFSIVVCMLATLMMLLGVGVVSASDSVGSEQCASCHEKEFNFWQASGHPYKIRKASKVRYLGIPLPPGYDWSDISYVIGGANKKARFIGLDGYINYCRQGW